MAGVERRSSSNDLSSAPDSDIEGSFARQPPASNQESTITVALDPPRPSSGPAKTEGSPATGRQEAAPTKPQRKPRKKKEVDPNAPPKEEKKPRKPRAAANSSAASRKKLKTETMDTPDVPQHVSQTTELSASRLIQPASFVTDSNSAGTYEAAKYSQNGISNQHSAASSQPQSPAAPRFNVTPQPQPAAPRSMPRFDPVRSITIEQPVQPSYPTTSSSNHTPPRPMFRASASPAIASIINPPEPTPAATQPFQPVLAYPTTNGTTTLRPINAEESGQQTTAMELDVPGATIRKSSTAEKGANEPETKPKRAKEQPPPLPTGSGLLSSSLFGGESGTTEKSDNEKGPNIVLHVDLKNPDNKIINFARLAEEKYGFAALYPRQAAQKERLARVAALGNALERSASNSKRGGSGGESGDEDLSVDIDRDSDNDGDVAMSGINGAPDNSGTDGPAPKKRKKRKDEYDADDPFVDDSELLWEAQAAASKDGFFVYCGPLVPEGEKPAVERADGTVKRGRGRGRGGGPGSRGGRGGAATASHSEGSGRGGGPGSRGGGVTRKPRMTKADRQQRELEKKQREQMATLAAKPPAATPT